jgi:transcriptional regulator with XRE-family HTH domain
VNLSTRKVSFCKTFLERLQRLLKDRGVHQCELAKGTGLCQASIHKYLHGSMPGSAELGSIADFFGVTTDSLLGRESGGVPAAPALREVPAEALVDDALKELDDLKEKVQSLDRALKRLKEKAR